MGSWGALAGSERVGATTFPFGAGVQGQTLAAVQWAREIRPSAFYGTPSYALHFAETARREGIDPRSFGFRILFFSGEPGAGIASTKRLIEETFGGICIDSGSMAEMSPWMTNSECPARAGMHLWQDLVYTEVCDPETYRRVPYGSEGTPVYTHLERTSQPMIRLVSGDRARWTDEPCPCGRTYPRLPSGIYGRFDDMLVVRGENVYPSGIEDALRAVPGFGGEFRVIVSRRDTMDELLVRAEYTPEHEPADRREALSGRCGTGCALGSGATPWWSWFRKERSRARSSRPAGSWTTVISLDRRWPTSGAAHGDRRTGAFHGGRPAVSWEASPHRAHRARRS
jgi:phenylacetate-CoA ligase